MSWAWDPDKNERNKREHHGLSFETAQLVFDDPLALSRLDQHPDEERWQTIGVIGHVTVLVVHTTPTPKSDTGEEVGRIISARKATSHERKAYEEGEF
ncbi:MAG: BrnT family toxin [Stellaceae bacterium]